MTIHSEHPFAEAHSDQLRRFRGHSAAAVTVWAAQRGDNTADAWTVSSQIVVLGAPGAVLGLIDPDSMFADLLVPGQPVSINLLGARHSQVAQVCARLMPAPGGIFTVGDWQTSPAGPRLVDAAGWISATVSTNRELGWFRLIELLVHECEVTERASLGHVRGEYFNTDQIAGQK